MDFEMQTVVNEKTRERTWDFMIEDGKLVTIPTEGEERQRAIIAAYLQRGTIPQMPATGNQWAEFMTGQVMPQVLNSQIRQSIMDLTGALNYAPKYTEVDGKISVDIMEV